jgi:hypothetical protein
MESQQSPCSDGLASLPENLQVRVIYDDDMVLIINKPRTFDRSLGTPCLLKSSGSERRTRARYRYLEKVLRVDEPDKKLGWKRFGVLRPKRALMEIDKYLARLGASERYLTSIFHTSKVYNLYSIS